MRTIIAAMLGLGLLAGACKQDPPRHPSAAGPSAASIAELDALWALAPPGTPGGVVISPRGLAMLEGGFAAVQALLAGAPELADAKRKLDDELRSGLGSTSLTLAGLGLATDKGVAMFFTEAGVIVLALADRDRFLATVHGTKGPDVDRIGGAVCRPIRDRYACSRSAAMLDTLGRGALAGRMAAAGARGDIEIVGADLPLPGSTRGRFAAAIQLERGAFTIRGTADLPGLLARFAAPPAKPRLDAERPAGFVIANLAQLARDLPPIPIGGTTIAAVGASLAGPLTISMPTGGLGFELQQPLSEPAPMRALIEHCPELAALAGLTATSRGGTCRLAIPKPAIELEATVAGGNTLQIRTRSEPGPKVTLSPLGAELAAGEWTAAAWGRGTIFGAVKLLDLVRDSGASDELQMGVRMLELISELGAAARVDGDSVHFVLGVRTAFANPDDVIARLTALPIRQLIDGSGLEAARAIAAAAPRSPFATDLASGQAGFTAISGAIGVLAAVAIPMFMDSMKKPKRTESVVNLNRIGKMATEQYVTNAAFPIGKAALTPAIDCCTQNFEGKRKCAPDPSQFATPMWRALDFEIDRPHMFQYSYESTDGKKFTATAVGDLDCDGIPITYRIEGSVENGAPRIRIDAPPPNTD